MKIAKLNTEVTMSKEDTRVTLQGIANSLTMTRSGIRVTEDAGKSVVGKVVPLLLAHNWDKPSVGQVTMTNVDTEGLHYKATLYDSFEDRETWIQGVEGGTTYVSIGFGVDNIDTDGNIDSIDLLEMSLTSVPADAKATAEIVKQAIEKEEDNNMDDEPKTQPADDEAPTLQDVLDAISDLKKDVDDAKPKDDKLKDDDTTADDKDAEVQSLKEQIAILQSFMPAVDRRSLSLTEEMAFDRLHY